MGGDRNVGKKAALRVDGLEWEKKLRCIFD
jgi:hypothetical protein